MQPGSAPEEPSEEIRPGGFADLFRSEGTATVLPESWVRSLSSRFAAVSDLLRQVKETFNGLSMRWQIGAILASAVLVGCLAAMILMGSRRLQHAAAERERHSVAREVDIAPSQSDVQLAALEEKLQKAVEDREAARHDREQTLARLQQVETAAKTQNELTRQEVRREQAARRLADEQRKLDEDRLRRARLQTYNAQLARVRETWRGHPGTATALLEDVEHCPPDLRDFAWNYFYKRARTNRASLTGHVGPVRAVRWSPDGKLLASCGEDGQLKLWDPVSHRQTASIAAHLGGVNGLTFSQSGQFLASAGNDGAVKLWDVASRTLTATFFGHLGSVRCVAIAGNGSNVVSGGDDGTVRFWQVGTREPRATRWGIPRSGDADAPAGPVRSVTLSPDGRWIASGTDGFIRVWSADTADEAASFPLTDENVAALAFSPTSRTLVAATDVGLHRWNTDSMRPVLDDDRERFGEIMSSGSITEIVRDLSFSPDGRMLAAALGEGAILLPQTSESQNPGRAADDSDTGSMLAVFRRKPIWLRGHIDAATGVAFSPDGQMLATCGADGTVKLWNPMDGRLDTEGPDSAISSDRPAASITYSPDGTRLAAARDNRITLWDAQTLVEGATLKSEGGDLTNIAFSPDGSLLAAASKDWPVLVWDLDSQRIKTALVGHSAGVNSVRYSSNGKIILSASDDGAVRMWDAGTGRPIARLDGHKGPVLTAIFSPDGKLAASAGADHSVQLWNVSEKKRIAQLAGHDGRVVALAFSPQGEYLLSAQAPASQRAGEGVSNRGPIRIWRVADGKFLHAFGTIGSEIRTIILSPDGKTVASADRDRLTLWDAVTGELRAFFDGGSNGAFVSATFSPTGTTLTAGGGRGVLFWAASDRAPR
jgi:WD40 repeat protein